MNSTRKMNHSVNLDNPHYYNNRELSWLAFNKRVLEEAMDVHNPLLERFKFLAIFSSNLDEFFMIRVAGLKDQVKVGFRKPENKAGLTPKEQLSLISQKTHEMTDLLYNTYNKTLLPLLEKEGVSFLSMKEASKDQLAFLETYFDTQIYTVLTPMAIDAYRPFPKLLSKSLNLAILINDEDPDSMKIGQSKGKLAIVPVPGVLGRIVELPSENSTKTFVLVEEIIAHFIHKLFKGYDIRSITPFRITRNADLTIEEDGARDLLKVIEQQLKKRKWGAEVRLEIQGNLHDNDILSYLQDKLEVHEKDTYLSEGPLDLTFLFSFHKKLEGLYEHLTYETFLPNVPSDLQSDDSIFDQVLKQDILLHHPYDSFEYVQELITTAADDPNVLAIKQTLYRVSGQSRIIKALKKAVENGKQVTVLVELKARFDEENNVNWAKELEHAGCNVIYGMTHLKTHSKITLIVRRRNGQNELFVHLGTGNYNGTTAKIYTDASLITANRRIGLDATNFFNYLSGYTEQPSYNHLSVAPNNIRNEFVALIDKEIEFHKKYQNGHIIAKMNSLSDKVLITKLYEASNAGVKIELIIRGICCLRPGIKGVSENITVRSILGRFLEHSRIFFFHHNGERKTFLSSADMMTRNMEDRVEILFPIFDYRLKERIQTWLSIMLADNVKAREQDSDGNYHYVKRNENDAIIHSQLDLLGK
ncbi:RNA degradosome polyphosphate kinase [Bacillus sp. B1-b2]|uniref:RNA degradosome polyphosphate kinase n=1 Tax=Bacillus sp. B1-b2 TaxID=2653201 RepID=UPI001261A7D5|nr:RNA degradosome polyphosphate kinase [Bacillus sp. B1-b2]KAB7670744.1 RNA degradosome polyphosphate kinase [Bacillus sp. B1-b2]